MAAPETGQRRPQLLTKHSAAETPTFLSIRHVAGPALGWNQRREVFPGCLFIRLDANPPPTHTHRHPKTAASTTRQLRSTPPPSERNSAHYKLPPHVSCNPVRGRRQRVLGISWMSEADCVMSSTADDVQMLVYCLESSRISISRRLLL